MSAVHDEILVRLELACAARALQHAHERGSNEGLSRELERLIDGLSQIYGVSSVSPESSEDENPDTQETDC